MFRKLYLMRFITILLFALLMYGPSLAQSNFVIEGQVVNQETDAPIAYANVGIPGKYIGTAGNDEGFFILTLPTGTESDTLQVSAIGFKTKRYEVVEFKKKGNQTVFLQPRTYSLNTVTVVDDKDLKTERIGTEKVGFFNVFLVRVVHTAKQDMAKIWALPMLSGLNGSNHSLCVFYTHK